MGRTNWARYHQSTRAQAGNVRRPGTCGAKKRTCWTHASYLESRAVPSSSTSSAPKANPMVPVPRRVRSLVKR